MITYILVHGTFAPNAAWAKPGSNLSCALNQAAESCSTPARFVKVEWSGHNSLAERQTASETIRHIVDHADPSEHFVIVGHSHGGSVIAYYLNQLDQIPETVLGCVFLSTPFIALRERIGVTKVATFALVILWLFSMRFADLIGLTGTFKDAVNGDVAGIAALLFIIFRKERDPQKNRIKQQTARLPQGEYLFLRSSGDEAAAALSFAQFSMWAATKLSHFLIRPRLMQIVTNRKTGDLAPWKISLAALFLYVSLEAPGRYFTTVSAPLVHFEEFRQVEALLWIIWLVGVVIFLSLSVVAIGFLLITLTAAVWMVTQAITSRAFGWASFMDSLMLDMAVEPVPFGSHRLDHFAWDSQPSSAGLTHSWIYEDPAALDRIREWTKSRLQARSS